MNRTSWVLSALGVAALIVLSLGSRTAGRELSYQLGEIAGTAFVALLVGLVVWSVIWAIARRGKRPWPSAWIVGIAVVVGFLATGARVADRTERTAEVSKLAGDGASEHLRECTQGSLMSYDEATPAEREQMPWTREQFSRIGAEYCREIERQGFFERDQLPSKAEQEEIMLTVVTRMEESGAIPAR